MRTQQGNPGTSIDQIAQESINGGLNATQLQGFGGGFTTAGNAAVFDVNGCVVDGGSTAGGGNTHAEVLVDSSGNPIPTSTGDWIYVLGVPNA